MKLGIMADSHDNLPMIRRALERFQAEGATGLIHAGDFIAPFAVKEILRFNGPVHGCFGNNDGEKVGIRRLWPEVSEPPGAVSLGGLRIVFTHDLQSVEDRPDLVRDADVIVFGHTHAPLVEVVEGESSETRLHVNPGETGGWLTGRCTAALLDTDTREARILELY